MVPRTDQQIAGSDQTEDRPIQVPNAPSDEHQHRQQEQDQVRAPRVAGHDRSHRHDGACLQGTAGRSDSLWAQHPQCQGKCGNSDAKGDGTRGGRTATNRAEECVGLEKAGDGSARRMVFVQTRPRADRRQDPEQILEEVLRRRHQPQDDSCGRCRGQHRPPSSGEDQDPDGCLNQLQCDFSAQGEPTPPATVDPRQQPDPRERQQQQVHLTLFDVAGDSEGERHEHEQNRKLPVVHFQGLQREPEEDDERGVEDDDHRHPERVAIDMDGRLQEPGQQGRHDVLGTGRFQAAESLAQVIGIEAGRNAAGGPEVALLEVALVGPQQQRLHEAAPEVQDRDRNSRPDEQQPAKAPIGQRRQPDRRRPFHQAEIIGIEPACVGVTRGCIVGIGVARGPGGRARF
ncbi:MAG: hypothetical protein AUI42_05300 [Actinobacteria bacterium 13_1_40CM_2_65_8]|nr:MAG: hypothetical protein AUI42_05300 [Actinobacteria bacterium 13_1_40CM_2_65_8]